MSETPQAEEGLSLTDTDRVCVGGGGGQGEDGDAHKGGHQPTTVTYGERGTSTRLKHANRHSSKSTNTHAATPLNLMFVWSRGEGWGGETLYLEGGGGLS